MRKNSIILILILSTFFCKAQETYWVFFTDKNETGFNPYSYFSDKAIERRQKQNLPLFDYTDLPINQKYVKKVQETGAHTDVQLRWFNAVYTIATDEQILSIEKLPFVKETKPVAVRKMTLAKHEAENINEDNQFLLDQQIKSLEGNQFINSNITGKGIRVAIFDAGFPSVDHHEAFAHIRNDDRIIATWDFVKNKEFVYDYNSHGTTVMSCIGGKINDQNIGLATGAEFLLARTEKATEPLSEEKNWLAAVEWADKNGADIINSSLGYTFHRYFRSDMDGKTSLVVKAANLAASKGILVVNALGNDGDSKWKMLGTPADADSILSIGGTDPYTGIKISFSSYGPTASGKLKPNVSAHAHVYAANKSSYSETYGTSFSSPLVAGFAACAWETRPNITNMELFDVIQQSGSLYPYFDYVHGYGNPQASYFLDGKSPEKKYFTIVEEEEDIKVEILEFPKGEKYLYYHIEGQDGILKVYKVIEMDGAKEIEIPVNKYKPGVLRVHIGSQTESIEL
ncbi:MAG: hypothetical protein C0594_07940 [Marinilabiliales bacterium]|nr:MAG: hypothetical protein C0594_07940 [Marinilabiliales bacterium]